MQLVNGPYKMGHCVNTRICKKKINVYGSLNYSLHSYYSYQTAATFHSMHMCEVHKQDVFYKKLSIITNI